MFARNLIKRSLVAGLAVGAASLPAAAQASFIEGDPAAPVTSSAVSTPPVQQHLDQLQSTVRQRPADEGGLPSVASSVRSMATSQGGFQWGDAGIGAAGMIVLLGTGAGAASGMRRRRAQRALIG